MLNADRYWASLNEQGFFEDDFDKIFESEDDSPNVELSNSLLAKICPYNEICASSIEIKMLEQYARRELIENPIVRTEEARKIEQPVDIGTVLQYAHNDKLLKVPRARAAATVARKKLLVPYHHHHHLDHHHCHHHPCHALRQRQENRILGQRTRTRVIRSTVS